MKDKTNEPYVIGLTRQKQKTQDSIDWLKGMIQSSQENDGNDEIFKQVSQSIIRTETMSPIIMLVENGIISTENGRLRET